MKRCTKCGEEKPLAEFSRARSRKDGRAAHCKACVRRWRQENAEHLAEYHRRWQRANREKKRAQDRRYRERKRQDPDYWERRRARDRRLPGGKASPTLRYASRGKRRLRLAPAPR
jgi:hypothetical protein